MLKLRDTRIYDINRLLEVYDPLSLNPESMDIPRLKAHDLNMTIKAFITKESECISSKSAELSVHEVLDETNEHIVLHL